MKNKQIEAERYLAAKRMERAKKVLAARKERVVPGDTRIKKGAKP